MYIGNYCVIINVTKKKLLKNKKMSMNRAIYQWFQRVLQHRLNIVVINMVTIMVLFTSAKFDVVNKKYFKYILKKFN